MEKITIPMRAKSKPRGMLGKYKNLTHSAKDYRPWQQQFIKHLSNSGLKIKLDKLYLLASVIYLIPKSGGQPDASNMLGAIEDTLIKGGILKDDNWQLMPRIYCDVIKSPVDKIAFFLIHNESEFQYFFANYQKFL